MFIWNEIQVKCDLRNHRKFEHVLYLKHVRKHILKHTHIIFIYYIFICYYIL